MTTPTSTNLLPHILLGQDPRVVKAIEAHAGTPWRKRSRMQGDFGLEQVFEHPASRTWVKILQDPWGEKIIGVTRRQQDLPNAQTFLAESLNNQKPGTIPTFSKDLIGEIAPLIDEDLKHQSLARQWVLAWSKAIHQDKQGVERALRAMSKEIPVAVANQFRFGVQIEETQTSNHTQAFFNAAQMSLMQKMGGNNLLMSGATLVIEPFTGGAEISYDEDDDESYVESKFPDVLKHLLPHFSGKERGWAEDSECYDLFEAALKVGFIWDAKLQKRLDQHTSENASHLNTGGSQLAAAFEKAKLRKELNAAIPVAANTKKRL